jgi:hypothetical protein
MHMQMNDATERRLGFVHLVLGVLQVFGAALTLTLLVLTGISKLSLGAAIATGLLTTISILLFGGRRSASRVEQK